jgi:Family of unknown function (DUF6454)
MRRVLLTAIVIIAGLTLTSSGLAGAQRDDDPVVRAVEQLTRSNQWTLRDSVPLSFPTHHPQGFARFGDRLFMSTVEIIERPVIGPTPDGYDRTPGRGVGHLLVMDLQGHLQADIVLGEGHKYHPGGIDVDQDGTVWVPVAEYRPNSHAMVYAVDARTLAVTEVFRYDDHIGGIVRDTTDGKLHGVSWGSRRLFTWTQSGLLLNRTANESHFVDYQDCAAYDSGKAVCTGLTEYRNPPATGRFDLGGIAVLDLHTSAVGHEVPVTVLSPASHVITRNPVHLEVVGTELHMWAAPDDAEEPGGTTLLHYSTPFA